MSEEAERLIASIRVQMGRTYLAELRGFWDGSDPNCFSRMISERRSAGYQDYTVSLGSEKEWIANLRNVCADELVLKYFAADAVAFENALDARA